MSQSAGRWLPYQVGEAAWNMAVDQAILESVSRAAENGDAPGPTLRFYGWSAPTLSLGYFQSSGDASPRFDGVDRVRRSTGGGAIVHDRELTYSLVMPLAINDTGSRLKLYRQVHECVASAVEDVLGLPLKRFADDERVAGDPKSFLCFQRRTEEDLVLSGYKMLGSAQRRTKAAVLQHGSLLLGASPLAPELPGLRQFGPATEPEPIAHRLVDHLSNRLSVSLSRSAIGSEEAAAAEVIVGERFGAPEWWTRR